MKNMLGFFDFGLDMLPALCYAGDRPYCGGGMGSEWISMNLNAFGIMLMSLYSFCHISTFVHVQTSRNVFFSERQTNACGMLDTSQKSLGWGTGDRGQKYSSKYPI